MLSNQRRYLEIIKLSNEDIAKYIDTSNCPIYHYTSPVALNEIIRKHTLRFTDRNYLNDYSEGRYVMKLCLDSRFELKLPKSYRKHFRATCMRLYETPTKKQRHVYQCSFSTAKDNLSLWNYYTKSDGIKGYNIGFYSKDLENGIDTNPSLPDVPAEHKVQVFSGRVIYSIKKQKEILKSVVHDFSEVIAKHIDEVDFCNIAVELLVEKILHIGSFFKSPYFSHEKEFRLLIKLVAIWNEENAAVEFMSLGKGASTYEKNGLLIPYVDLTFSRDALKSITVSPTLSFEEISSNINNALKLHAYNQEAIQIDKSEIPVRY